MGDLESSVKVSTHSMYDGASPAQLASSRGSSVPSGTVTPTMRAYSNRHQARPASYHHPSPLGIVQLQRSTSPVSSTTRRYRDKIKHAQIAETTTTLDICVAIYDFSPTRADELALCRGDEIVVEKRASNNWWLGTIVGTNKSGLFPANYVKVKQSVV